MATSFNLPTLQSHHLLHKSHFLGNTNLTHKSSSSKSFPPPKHLTTTAKFNLFEILGGRGLCNGEEGLQKELKNPPPPPPPPPATGQENPPPPPPLPENAFEKELLGLTGGFPGGEKGLKDFIEKNPPPKKTAPPAPESTTASGLVSRKAKAPELPLLMPGMIAIVKNSNSPYYMYCGIVQRISDGKAGVLFEGGNWDRLITFRLNELERREKGPPMVSPRSVVLEEMIEKSSS